MWNEVAASVCGGEACEQAIEGNVDIAGMHVLFRGIICEKGLSSVGT